MQLTPLIAQPPAAPPPADSGLLRLTTTLRTPPVSADQAVDAVDAVDAGPAAIAAAATGLDDAGIAARVLGKVGSRQQRYLENQQLLGMVSAVLGERISHIGSQAWAMLRGRTSADGQ
jgi:hypothetical protein